MHLQLLQETPTVSVYHDVTNDWLFADWRGHLTLPMVQANCLTIAQCFLARPYPRILNSNCEVQSMSADVAPWLAGQYLPHLGLAGIEYLAWVCAPDLLLKHLAGEAVRQLRTPMVVMFDDLENACAWLQHTRIPADEATGPDAARRQAELNFRVEALLEEVSHLEGR
ncbi:hypothetical protein [Hymenobacter ruricola]|uniref:STAS/SEC14 domain-containing protein n=1 Tax=Hymenobacter ruricola TaxID=2791023 RepID=A0ABS0I3C7_9BACT|nr:hypothetical protein [Hymenobacter ruricola]MBF9221438.1 hypothetical protein [Hymenobacter ruricola]